MKWSDQINQMFIRIFIMFCLTTFILGGTTSARIRAQGDFNDSIAYYVNDKWTNFTGENTATFVKYIYASGEEKYWLRVSSGLPYRSQQFADIILDGDIFRIEQLEDPRKEYLRCGFHLRVTNQSAFQYTMYKPAYTMFFNLSPEIITKMLNSQKIELKLKHDVQKPTVLAVDHEIVKEIQKVIKFKSADFSQYVASD